MTWAAIGVLIPVVLVVFGAGRWVGKSDATMTTLFNGKRRNGNGNGAGPSMETVLLRLNQVDEKSGVIARTVDATNRELGEVSARLRVAEAQRVILIDQNKDEHKEFREFLTAIERRVQRLEARP